MSTTSTVMVTAARTMVPVVVAMAGSSIPAVADGGTVMAMHSILRACDFSKIPDLSSADRGTASAVIHVSGRTVTADIHFAEPNAPGSHFDVDLIQLPRASTAPCDTAGPGVAVGTLDTDGAGIGNATVRDTVGPGTTKVWLFIRKPSLTSQSPAEFYTSDFAAKV